MAHEKVTCDSLVAENQKTGSPDNGQPRPGVLDTSLARSHVLQGQKVRDGWGVRALRMREILAGPSSFLGLVVGLEGNKWIQEVFVSFPTQIGSPQHRVR